jgi:hypothetical protein
MKKSVFLFFAGIIALSGCKDTVTDTITYMINEPVFMSAKAYRESVVVSPTPQPISNYGKMCFYDGYIYISESGKGVHIVNNTNPSNPKNVGFIELLGNADLAIRNDILYADALIDLVWFDISNPAIPELDGRLEGVFAKYMYMPMPQTDNEYGIDYNLCYNPDGSARGIVVGWELKRRTEEVTYENRSGWLGGGMKDGTSMFSYASVAQDFGGRTNSSS